MQGKQEARLKKFGKAVLGEEYQTPDQRQEMDRTLEEITGQPVMTIKTEQGPETIIGLE